MPTPRLVSSEALMEDYAQLARRRGPRVLVATALRARSVALRDVAAHLASGGRASAEAVLADPAAWVEDAPWAATLARVVGLQNLLPTDRAGAVRVLRSCLDELPRRERVAGARLLAELLLAGDDLDAARLLLQSETGLAEPAHAHLHCDVVNPFTADGGVPTAEWSARLRALFAPHGLQQPDVAGEEGRPFDRLVVDTDRRVSGPLVSVVMTTYAPDAAALRASVDSILAQTWTDLELIVVDDCSPPEHGAVLDGVAAADGRVRVIRLEENGGTYRARNVGRSAARGELVTGQDDDDWSHPERLERQVGPLLEDPALPATRSMAVACDERLRLSRPGYPASVANASSLMYRRALGDELGGYLEARKAADTEFHQRLEAYTGRDVLTLPDPLAMVRLRASSLSRSDFAPGWRHPARRAFRDAYERWHTSVGSREELRVDPTHPPVPVPRAFQVRAAPARAVDVLLAGDWRSLGGPQRSMLEEIKALRSAGLTVGVMHLEAARFMTRHHHPLCAPVNELIDHGVVTQVIEDEPVEARLVMLRYPPILQFPPHEPLAVRAERVALVANQAPSERDGSDIRYRVDDCTAHAERLFGCRPTWVPQGPTVREAIAPLLDPADLHDEDLPGVLDVREWAIDRSVFRSERPVLGRHSRDNAMKWPSSAEDLAAAYPTDGSVDVRVMGGTRVPQEVLGVDRTPLGWVSFDKDELDARTFLSMLDYYVFFPHPEAYEAFGRAILEAIATGCVTVLPRHFEQVFGDAAVYAEPSQVRALITRLHGDPESYRKQSDRALDAVRGRFGLAGHVARVNRLLALPPRPA